MATRIDFSEVPERFLTEEVPILFSWPQEGANLTYTVSINNGQSFNPGQESITENPQDGGHGEYLLPYNSNERPSSSGIVVYNIVDDTDSFTAKLYVSIRNAGDQVASPPSPGVGSGTLLTSRAEMELIFHTSGVDAHFEDLADDTDALNLIITWASETVLQYLRHRYDDEDMVTSQWVRQRATYIALYLLSKRGGNPGLYLDEYMEAQLDCGSARDGMLAIGIPTVVRAIQQTPQLDNRMFQPLRVNPNASTKIVSGQRTPYLISYIY